MKKRPPSACLPAVLMALSAAIALSQPLKEVPDYALKAGQLAPPLHADTVLKAPGDLHFLWSALRGRAIILDFWASWCPPCISGFAHVNALVKHYRGNGAVQFIAVGHENPAKISWFLKSHPINTWIVLDTSLIMFRSYTAFGIPHGVIIDRNGVVAAVLNPSEITTDIIDAVLKGRLPAVKPLPPEAYFNPETAAEYFKSVGREKPPAGNKSAP